MLSNPPRHEVELPKIAVVVALALVAAPLGAQTDTDIQLLSLESSGERVTVVGPPRPVTDRDGYDNQPHFTADGRCILYTSIRDGQADTYRFHVSSGHTERVTRTPESEYSPTPIPGEDRFSVVRVERDSTQRLWSFAHDGSDARLLLPDVAPVGYTRQAGDDWWIEELDVATGETRFLAPLLGPDDYHVWTPDGRLLAVVVDRPRPPDVQPGSPGNRRP